MRELIGEQPNVIPTGLGNSQTDIDTSAMLGLQRDSDKPEVESNGRLELFDDPTRTSTEVDDHDNSDDDKSDISRAAAKAKRKAPMTKEEPNKAQKTSSEGSKATVAQKGEKKKSLVEKFTEVAELKELTAQKKADAEKAKSAAEVARIKVKGEVQMEREWCKTAKLQLKSELLAMKKMKMEHEMVIKLRRQSNSGGGNAGPSSSSMYYGDVDSGTGLQLPVQSTSSHDAYRRGSSTFSYESHSENFAGDISFDNL